MSSKQYFEDVATRWDAMRSGFFPENVRQQAANKAGVVAGSVAADLGAGTGFVTEELLSRGLSVIAVDQSQAMLGAIRTKFGDKRVDCRLGEAGNLPIASQSVDYAFANMYLHHVEDPAGAIREMARILKPGGKLVITDLDEHNFEFLRTEQHDRWLGFRREDIVRWFGEAGLANVSVDCLDENCCATSNVKQEEAKVSIFLAHGEIPTK